MAAPSNLRPAPAVSIGLPVYNGAPYIREALDSLLAQTFADFELIISDNASTDETEAICREFAAKDARVRYFRQPENVGPIRNFLFVLEHAAGRYFMWAAHDDYWRPEFVSACVAALQSNNEFAFAVTRYRIVSRLSFLLSRFFVAGLWFVGDRDRERRVLKYSCMPFHTHKDNLIYGLWKRDALLGLIRNMQRAGMNSLNGVMMEYALSCHRGAFVNEVLFHKKYRYAVPGHFLNPALGLLQGLVRPVVDKARRKQLREKTRRQQAGFLYSGLSASRTPLASPARSKRGRSP